MHHLYSAVHASVRTQDWEIATPDLGKRLDIFDMSEKSFKDCWSEVLAAATVAGSIIPPWLTPTVIARDLGFWDFIFTNMRDITDADKTFHQGTCFVPSGVYS